MIQEKIAHQGELICMLIGPIAVYQFYHYLEEECSENLWHFIFNVRDPDIITCNDVGENQTTLRSKF